MRNVAFNVPEVGIVIEYSVYSPSDKQTSHSQSSHSQSSSNPSHSQASSFSPLPFPVLLIVCVSFTPHLEQVLSLEPFSVSVGSFVTVHSPHKCPRAGDVSFLDSKCELSRLQILISPAGVVQVASFVSHSPQSCPRAVMVRVSVCEASMVQVLVSTPVSVQVGSFVTVHSPHEWVWVFPLPVLPLSQEATANISINAKKNSFFM
jgi:hypothetical protein